MDESQTGAVELVPVDEVRKLHRKFASGVTIVTARVGEENRGLVVNAFSSVSLDPPLILIAVNRMAATHDFLYRTPSVAVSIVSDEQVDLVRRFSSPVADKFEGVDWQSGANGSPIISHSSAYLEGNILSRLQVHSHTMFIVRITRVVVSGLFTIAGVVAV